MDLFKSDALNYLFIFIFFELSRAQAVISVTTDHLRVGRGDELTLKRLVKKIGFLLTD